MSSRRTTLALLSALALTITTAASAHAHVTVDPSTATADAHIVLTFSVPHGCEGSSTTALAIQVPEEITSVTPTAHPAWDVEVVAEEVAEPTTDAHGAPVTERIAEVRYTARTPLPDALRDSVELAVHLPAETAGSTLSFPVLQTCDDGENAWVQLAGEGQDPHTLQFPAPQVTVEAAAGDAHPDSGHDTAQKAAVADAAPSTLSVVALVVASLALCLAMLALLRRRETA